MMDYNEIIILIVILACVFAISIIIYNSDTQKAIHGGSVLALVSDFISKSQFENDIYRGLDIGDEYARINVVDVANMCSFYDMNAPEPVSKVYKKLVELGIYDKLPDREKAKKTIFSNQDEYIDIMINCIGRHYKLANKRENSYFIYVIKNMRSNNGGEIITNSSMRKFKKFVKSHNNTYIALAEDYKQYDRDDWFDAKKHYLRGIDDYLCMFIAEYYYSKTYKVNILSNDKFRDFPIFNMIPKFKATIIKKEGAFSSIIDPSSRKLMDMRKKALGWNDKRIG